MISLRATIKRINAKIFSIVLDDVRLNMKIEPTCAPANAAIPAKNNNLKSSCCCPKPKCPRNPEIDKNMTIKVDVATAFLVLRPITISSGTIKVPPPIPTREDTVPMNRPLITAITFMFLPSSGEMILLRKSNRTAARISIIESRSTNVWEFILGAMYEPISAPSIVEKMRGNAIIVSTSRCLKYVMDAEAVVIAFNSNAIGMAVRRGKPSQKKRGVYMMAPPSPSIEKSTDIRNVMNIRRIKSIRSCKSIPGFIMLWIEDRFKNRNSNIVRKDTNE